MHIITSQIYTIFSYQNWTLYPLLGKHTIFSYQKCTLYPLLTNSHYILFSQIHIIYSSQYYIYFTEIHIIYSSKNMQIVSSSRNTHYILFTGIHLSSFQIKKIFPLHRRTHYIVYSEMDFSQKLTISSFEKNIISSSHNYIYYTEIHVL
jgi:hypothetical protein